MLISAFGVMHEPISKKIVHSSTLEGGIDDITRYLDRIRERSKAAKKVDMEHLWRSQKPPAPPVTSRPPQVDPKYAKETVGRSESASKVPAPRASDAVKYGTVGLLGLGAGGAGGAYYKKRKSA